eukprot:1491613-Alexandrium_andersonii.AAC.1
MRDAIPDLYIAMCPCHSATPTPLKLLQSATRECTAASDVWSLELRGPWSGVRSLEHRDIHHISKLQSC